MFPFAFAWLSIHLPEPFVPSISHPLPVQSVHNWATVHTALVDSAAPRGFLTPFVFCFTFPRFSLRTQSKDLGKSTFLSSSALSEEQMRKSLSNLQKQSVTHEIICFQKKPPKIWTYHLGFLQHFRSRVPGSTCLDVPKQYTLVT